MSNSTSNIDQISTTQAQKEIVANGNFNAASPAMLWGIRQSTTSGLTVGLYGGTYYSGGTANAIANSAVTLTASATNYIYANASTGAVSVNTTGFPAGSIPLYTVVAAATTMASWTDERSFQPSALYVEAIYDVGGYIEAAPVSSEIAWGYPAPRAWTLPAGASGVAVAQTGATSASTFNVVYEPASGGSSVIGTISFAAGGSGGKQTGTVNIATATTFSAGDMLYVQAPSVPDATLADIAFVFAGTR